MLRNIPAILSPDLLHALRAMGHGDEIVIADANFPAESCALRVIRLDGVSATETLGAVLQLMPLDTFDPKPALTMQVVDDPDAEPDIVAAFQEIIDRTADHPAQLAGLERFAFYERARSAYAIVQTGEQRLYGNIIVKKGIVQP
ncbi:fucose binding protein [Litchfieldella anticariensis FP35 = DSM 16096]|uniref:Fucose binding protein n=1 Tax=Litchfieldella anticariensis (strain DSM 16096 / CECT 5854 / CIP 108499 / LMG 22089 / FP35) TaxID=1121939 RepID=S2L4T5_LITA3|nr:RbsD/FucU domain-containing protein [Halomonas anticariensis]EPC02734.1 fucose binding protein [Halomonas anticariensis FP35 = DSM 16096]